jgi:hypothetical protein
LGQRRRRSETPQAVTPPHDAIPKQRGQARHSMMTEAPLDNEPPRHVAGRGGRHTRRGVGTMRRTPSGTRRRGSGTHSPDRHGTSPSATRQGDEKEKDSHGDGAGDATRRQQRTARECGPSVQTARKVGVGDTATRRHPSRRKRFEKTCDDRERNAARMESPNVQVQGTLRGFIAQRPLERRVRPHTYALREWRATY